MLSNRLTRSAAADEKALQGGHPGPPRNVRVLRRDADPDPGLLKLGAILGPCYSHATLHEVVCLGENDPIGHRSWIPSPCSSKVSATRPKFGTVPFVRTFAEKQSVPSRAVRKLKSTTVGPLQPLAVHQPDQLQALSPRCAV